MKRFLSAGLWVTCLLLSQTCFAQLSIESGWHQRNGLTVASSQSVVVPAKKLRFFVKVESVDAEPRQAIADLNEKKKSVMTVLQKMGVQEETVQVTAVRILEFEDSNPRSGFFGGGEGRGLLQGADLESKLNTAIKHLSFDIPVDGMDADKRVVLFHDTYQRLRREATFELNQIEAVFVGKIEKSQIADARKKAYDEALADAKSIAALTGKSLGKLAAITAGVDGRFSSELSYQSWYAKWSLAKHFAPNENEVFGSDASKLSRTYDVELRFNLE